MNAESVLRAIEYDQPVTNGTVQTDLTNGQENTDATEIPLRCYRIEVRNQGGLIAEHTVAATDVLNAINLVEREYGEVVEAEIVTIENEHGRHRQLLIAKNWHGYTFDAREIPAYSDFI